MKKLLVFCGIAALALWATPAFATSITDACPQIDGGNAGGYTPYGPYVTNLAAATDNIGCNVLITFNANGSITTTNPNTAPYYDSGGDDNLVGVVNNTNHSIPSVFLSSAGDIFGFDADGVCDPPGFTAGGNPIPGCVSGYGPTGVSFSPVNNFMGTVLFSPGISPGEAAWFSLEGPVDLNLQVRPGPAVPEPATLLLLGTGLLGLARLKLRS